MFYVLVRFSQRSRDLAQLLEDVGDGDYGQAVSRSRFFISEIDRIQQGIAAAASRLRQREDYLKEINGKLEHMVAERTRRLEESNRDLRHAQSYIIEADKLAGINRATADFAHELNNALGVMVTTSSLMEDEIARLHSEMNYGAMTKADFEKSMGVLTDSRALIDSSTAHALELVREYRDLTADRVRERSEAYDLAAYIRRVAAGFAYSLAGNGIELHLDLPESLLVTGNPGHLYQILSNLILNSQKHGFDRQYEILCGDIHEKRIYVELNEKRDWVRLTYRDTGRGMNEETRAQAFEPFFTTKSEDGGTGLGMGVIHNLVVNFLKGDIELHSGECHGMTLTLRFPRDPGSNREEGGI
jgi:signal transduction histidine kinase